MNTLNSKTNKANRFVYQFTDKLNLKNPNKNIALANLSIYCTLNLNTTTANLKFLPQLGIMNLICPMDLILFLIFKMVLNTSLKKHETIADNLLVQISVNKIKKNKTGWSLK